MNEKVRTQYIPGGIILVFGLVILVVGVLGLFAWFSLPTIGLSLGGLGLVIAGIVVFRTPVRR
jgi:hypothetical protein